MDASKRTAEESGFSFTDGEDGQPAKLFRQQDDWNDPPTDANAGTAAQTGAPVAAASGANDVSLQTLEPGVRAKLNDLFARGVVRPDEIDEKALGQLSGFSTAAAIDILDQFEHSGLQNVRNKSAYLVGVMVRFKRQGGPRLPPEVQQRLDQLYRQGRLKPSDLDQKCFEALLSVHPHAACRVIDRVAAKDLSEVRNMSAFFMAQMKQEHQAGSLQGAPGAPQHYAHGAAPPPYAPPPPPAALAAPPPYYAPPPPPPPQQQPQQMMVVGGCPPAPPPAGLLPLGAPPPAMLPAGTPTYIAIPQPNGAPPIITAIMPAPGGAPGAPLSFALPPGLPGQALFAPAPLAGLPGAPPGAAPAPMMLLAPALPYAAMAPNMPPGLAGRKSYALEHAQLGLRCDEFHRLSVFAPYVHPAPALKLQQLWDAGVQISSQLDDRAWDVLSQLGAPEALSAIDELQEAQQRQDIRNLNAFFVSVARKYLDRARGASGAPPSQHQPHHPHQQPAPSYPHQPPPPHQPAQHVASAAPGGGYSGGGYRGPSQAFTPGGYGFASGAAAAASGAGGQHHHGHTQGGSGGGGGGIESLPPALRRKVEELLAVPYTPLGEGHFDEGVVEALRRLGEQEARDALEELAGTDLGTVRNLPAYIMGICKRYRGGQGGAPGGPKRY